MLWFSTDCHRSFFFFSDDCYSLCCWSRLSRVRLVSLSCQVLVRIRCVCTLQVSKPKPKVEDGLFGTLGGIGFTKENELFVSRVAMISFAVSALKHLPIMNKSLRVFQIMKHRSSIETRNELLQSTKWHCLLGFIARRSNYGEGNPRTAEPRDGDPNVRGRASPPLLYPLHIARSHRSARRPGQVRGQPSHTGLKGAVIHKTHPPTPPPRPLGRASGLPSASRKEVNLTVVLTSTSSSFCSISVWPS